MVPANRFEVLECPRCYRCRRGERTGYACHSAPGRLDVLAQHVLGRACGEPFLADELYNEVRSAAPYTDLPRNGFDDVIDFVATGGYALKSYEALRQNQAGQKAGGGAWANPRVRQRLSS